MEEGGGDNKLKVGEISSSCEMCCGTIMVVLIVLASACAKEASSGPDGLFLGRSGVIIHDCQIGPQAGIRTQKPASKSRRQKPKEFDKEVPDATHLSQS